VSALPPSQPAEIKGGRILNNRSVDQRYQDMIESGRGFYYFFYYEIKKLPLDRNDKSLGVNNTKLENFPFFLFAEGSSIRLYETSIRNFNIHIFFGRGDSTFTIENTHILLGNDTGLDLRKQRLGLVATLINSKIMIVRIVMASCTVERSNSLVYLDFKFRKDIKRRKSVSVQSSMFLSNKVTLKANQTTKGGGVFYLYESDSVFEQNVFVNNTLTNGNGGTITADCDTLSQLSCVNYLQDNLFEGN